MFTLVSIADNNLIILYPKLSIFAVHIPIYMATISQGIDFHYRKASNIRHTFVGNKIVDHSDVVGASPVASANYIFILNLTPGFNGSGKDNCKTRWETFVFWD